MSVPVGLPEPVSGRCRPKTSPLFFQFFVMAATGTVTTKINEIRHGSPFSAESPTEVRFVTAYVGPSGPNRPCQSGHLSVIWTKTATRDEFH